MKLWRSVIHSTWFRRNASRYIIHEKVGVTRYPWMTEDVHHIRTPDGVTTSWVTSRYMRLLAMRPAPKRRHRRRR